MAVTVAVAVAVSGGGAVAVAVPVAGLTKRFFNHIQKDFLINVWVYFPTPLTHKDVKTSSNKIVLLAYPWWEKKSSKTAKVLFVRPATATAPPPLTATSTATATAMYFTI